MPLTQVGRRGANVAGILRAWSMAGQAIRLLLQSQVSRNRFTAKCRHNHRNSHVQWKQNLCYVAKAFISSETKQPNGLDVIVFLVGWGWMFIFNGHVILGNTTFTYIFTPSSWVISASAGHAVGSGPLEHGRQLLEHMGVRRSQRTQFAANMAIRRWCDQL